MKKPIFVGFSWLRAQLSKDSHCHVLGKRHLKSNLYKPRTLTLPFEFQNLSLDSSRSIFFFFFIVGSCPSKIRHNTPENRLKSLPVAGTGSDFTGHSAIGFPLRLREANSKMLQVN